MREMDLVAIYPKPRLSTPDKAHSVYPYLLRGVTVERPDHVWASDITYIRLHGGFVYLTAIMDWYSRYVLSWELSNTLDAAFCVDALERALAISQPEIFNSDQGWVASQKLVEIGDRRDPVRQPNPCVMLRRLQVPVKHRQIDFL
jgi:putative transposase